MLSGFSTDKVENSARLPLPIGERVGVRGQRVTTTQTFPPHPAASRPTSPQWGEVEQAAPAVCIPLEPKS